MKIIGQDKLLNNISKINKEIFPQSIILEGDIGSGKHLIANYIAEHLDKKILDITMCVNLETLLDASLSTIPTVYLIDYDAIKDKEQNTFIKKQNCILKFIEEPNIYSTIIILTSNKNLLLPTIISRCTLFKLDIYKEDILKTFTNTTDDLLFKYLKTPGQLLNYQVSLHDIDNLVTIMIEKIDKAAISNTLTITEKLDIVDKNKLNTNLFLIVLCDKLKDYYISTGNIKYINCYNLVNNTYNKINSKFCNKERCIDTLLLEFKMQMKA